MLESFRKNDLAPLVLRLALGVVFIYHGGEKVLKGFGTGWGDDSMPGVVKFLVSWGELLCGLSVLAGFLAWLGAAGIIFIMAGAIAMVHGKNGFSLGQGGFEYNFVLIAVAAGVILLGSGPLSVDRYVFKRQPA
jgi:putative oxidoreductase